MADQAKGSGGEGKELSMEKRLLLAFILMGAVLFLTPYFYKSPPPAREPAPPAAEQASESPEAAIGTTPDSPARVEEEAVATAPAGAISAQTEQTYTIETALYKVTLSNLGGVVTSWVLKDHPDNTGNPLELVNQQAAVRVGYPFFIEFLGNAPALNPNGGLFAAKMTEGGLGIDFELSDGVTAYRKSFHFEQDRYLSNITSEAVHQGQAIPHLLVWRGGFGDSSVPNAASLQHSLFFNPADNKLVVNNADEADEGPITQEGRYSFAGLEDAYFAAVAVPRGDTLLVLRTFSDPLPAGTGDDQGESPHVGAGIGGSGRNSFPLYVGPKDLDLLKQIDPKLQQIVDFGWFSFLAKPLFLALKWVFNNWIENWGWAIVVLTVAINIVMFPLKLTSLKSMKKMQALQPEVKKIQEKYQGLSLRDPKKQQQNEEMMALYQKHGVNPMGGCVPMILQIPFFIAFYKVLTVAIELRGADWLWVTDLSRPETLPIRILPVAMVASQFVMQKMTPTTTVGSPGQQRIMYLMPLMMGFIFYGVSSGLVLYWLTSNIVGVAQQQLINKIGDKGGTAPVPVETKTKKKGRKS